MEGEMFKRKDKEKADSAEIAALKKQIAELEQGKIEQPLPELPEIPMPKDKLKTETVQADMKTETVKADMISAERDKTIMWLAKEFNEQYGGTFLPQDMEKIDTETLMLNILFGIYGELKLLREQLKK